MEIPERLKKDEFRFIKLAKKGKFPIEDRWNSSNNYKYDDDKLQNHLKLGFNYGVACGYGSLVVIDADTEKLQKRVENCLPDTFEILSGSGEGKHYYYICKGLDKPLRLQDEDGNNLGDVQHKGKQVVGPNSIHPSGNKYKIVNDVEIKEIYENELKGILWDMLAKENTLENIRDKGVEIKRELSGATSDLNVEDIISLDGFKKVAGEWQGSHPRHGSNTGRNFCVDPDKNVFYCHRHQCGGGPYQLIAIIEGIIKCEQAGIGGLDKEKFKKTIKIAKEKYGLEDD